MRKAAVLGSPIAHSLSPTIHNAAYRILGFDGFYEAREVAAGEIDSFLESNLTQKVWIGFSLTMPLKEQICLLAEKFEIHLDERSKRISSANTIYREGDQWRATSTDVTGFQFLLQSKKIAQVAILGAGGTARAAIEALPSDTQEIVIFRRNPSKDDELSRALSQRSLTFRNWSEITGAWEYPLVVNTVPSAACEEIEESFRAPEVFVDAIYSPWLPPLSQRALNSNCEWISGIDLLCAQALGQIRFMTGKTFDDMEMFETLRQVALRALS
jgi:shikimate dehydrogenase